MRRRLRRQDDGSFDWGVWLRSFGVWGLGIVGLLVTFYFTTTATLKEHERQFAEVGKKFDAFNTTQQKNYNDWAATQKEEAAVREKMREQFATIMNGLSTSFAGTKVQIDTIGKQLEGVTQKIDAIQSRQQQDTGMRRR